MSSEFKKVLAKAVKSEEQKQNGEKSKKILVSTQHNIIYSKIKPFSL